MVLLRRWVAVSAALLLWSSVIFEVKAATCGDFTDGLSREVALPPSTCYKLRKVRSVEPDATQFGEACLEIVENDEGKKCVSAQFTLTKESWVLRRVGLAVKADCGGFSKVGTGSNSVYDVIANVRQGPGAGQTSMTLEYCLDDVEVATNCCNQALCLSLIAAVSRGRRGHEKRYLVSDNHAGQSSCEVDANGFQSFAPRCQAILGCGDAASGPFRGFEAASSTEMGKVTVAWFPAVGASSYEIFLLDGAVEIDPETVDVMDIRDDAMMTQTVSGFVTNTMFTGLAGEAVVTLFMVAHFGDGRVETAGAREEVVVAALEPIANEGVRVLPLFDLSVEWNGTDEMTVVNPGSLNIAAGDFLEGIANGEDLPLGFFVSVQEVVRSGIPTVLVVRAAALNEIFEQLDMTVCYTVQNAKEGEFGEDTTAPSSRLLSSRQIIDDPDFDSRFSISKRVSFTSGPVTLQGEAGASIRVAVKIRIVNYSVQRFDFTLTGDSRLIQTASFQVPNPFNSARSRTLFGFTPKVFTLFVLGFPVPIVVSPKLDLFLKIFAVNPCTVVIQAGRVFNWEVRVSYTPGTGVVTSATGGETPVNTNVLPELVTTAELEAGLQLPIQVQVLGIFGAVLTPKASCVAKFDVDLEATLRYNENGDLGAVMLKDFASDFVLAVEFSTSLLRQSFLEALLGSFVPVITLTPYESSITFLSAPSIASLRIASVVCDEGVQTNDPGIVVRVEVAAFDLGIGLDHVSPQQWVLLGGPFNAEELVNDGDFLEMKYPGVTSFTGPSDISGTAVSTKSIEGFLSAVRIFKEEEMESLSYAGEEIECSTAPTETETTSETPTETPTETSMTTASPSPITPPGPRPTIPPPLTRTYQST